MKSYKKTFQSDYKKKLLIKKKLVFLNNVNFRGLLQLFI